LIIYKKKSVGNGNLTGGLGNGIFMPNS